MNPSTAALSIQRIGLATSSTPTFRAAHGLGDVRKLHPRLTFTPPPFRLPPGMSPHDHATESRLSHRGQRSLSTPALDLRSPRDRSPDPDSHRYGRPLVATCREQHRSGRSRPSRPKGASAAESPQHPPHSTEFTDSRARLRHFAAGPPGRRRTPPRRSGHPGRGRSRSRPARRAPPPPGRSRCDGSGTTDCNRGGTLRRPHSRGPFPSPRSALANPPTGSAPARTPSRNFAFTRPPVSRHSAQRPATHVHLIERRV